MSQSYAPEGNALKSIAVVQARTTSARLPAKVLLPVAKLPMAVLAALRAGNTGRRVIVATSDENSDDALADTLGSHGIECFRGSLNDTLARLVASLAELDNSTLVFRLTADNVFPDGKMLDEMEQEFREQELNYLYCNGETCGLPYGVSAELTQLSHLRAAARDARDSFDREHVTPCIIRKYGIRYFTRYKDANAGALRSTVDCLDDYQQIQKVFAKVENPVDISMQELVRLLGENPLYPITETAPTPRMVMGTAQLGMAYGVANTAGQPDSELAERLVKTAISNGVTCLDTARAYGASEEALGMALAAGWQGRATIITKLAPLTDCPASAKPDTVNAYVDASIYQSCNALRQQSLEVVLLHRASHLSDWGGAIVNRLMHLKNSGVINRLGVSAQNPQELLAALKHAEIEWIQLPFNILDGRWDNVIPDIQKMRETRPIVIHARSALLQGLITSTDPAHWATANVKDHAKLTGWLSEQVRACGLSNAAELALCYANSIDWIDGVVVGIETMDQLLDNIRIFGLPGLSGLQLQNIVENRPYVDEATLNPALWAK